MDSEDEDSSFLLRLEPFLSPWDLYERRSLKQLHERFKLLKERVNNIDITQYLENVESGSWITVLPCGRVYVNSRSCDARRMGSHRDVSYIFIIV